MKADKNNIVLILTIHMTLQRASFNARKVAFMEKTRTVSRAITVESAKKESLRAQIRDLENRYQAEVKRLQTAIAELESEAVSSASQETQINDLLKTVKHLMGQKSKLKSQVEKLQAEAMIQSGNHDVELTVLRESNAMLESKVCILEAVEERGERENQMVVDEFKFRMAELKSEARHSKAAVEEERAETEKLRGSNESLQEEVRRLKDVATTMSKEHAMDIGGLKKLNADLHSQVERLESEREKCSTEYLVEAEGYQVKIASLESEARAKSGERDGQVKEMKRQCKSLRAEVKSLTERLQSAHQSDTQNTNVQRNGMEIDFMKYLKISNMILLAQAGAIRDEYWHLAYAHDVLSDSLDDLRGGTVDLDQFFKSMDQVSKELRDIKRELREHQCSPSNSVGGSGSSAGLKKRPSEGGKTDLSMKRLRKA